MIFVIYYYHNHADVKTYLNFYRIYMYEDQ